MHRPNFDNMSTQFGSQHCVTPFLSCPSSFEEFSAVDEMIVLSSSDDDTVGNDLKGQSALILPESYCDLRFHTGWCFLARSIERPVRWPQVGVAAAINTYNGIVEEPVFLPLRR